jgi:hypothetical protein
MISFVAQTLETFLSGFWSLGLPSGWSNYCFVDDQGWIIPVMAQTNQRSQPLDAAVTLLIEALSSERASSHDALGRKVYVLCLHVCRQIFSNLSLTTASNAFGETEVTDLGRVIDAKAHRKNARSAILSTLAPGSNVTLWRYRHEEKQDPQSSTTEGSMQI